MAAPAAHPLPVPTAADQLSQLVLGGPGAWLPLMSSALHLVVNLAIGAGLLVVTLWAPAGRRGWRARRPAGCTAARRPTPCCRASSPRWSATASSSSA